MFTLGPAGRAANATPDANFGNVVLLLHGDGANAGTVFTDSSSFARTPSVATNVTTTTTQKKYGTASLSPTTNTAQLGWAASTDFAIVQIFTIEFWCYFTASSGSPRYLFSESATRFFSVNGTSIGGGPTFAVPVTGTIPLNTWTHVAFVRQSGVGRTYVNGVGTGATDTNSITSSATARKFQIYGVPDRADLLAPAVLIDDFRWTQNVARYTANFTPPTGPYNDF